MLGGKNLLCHIAFWNLVSLQEHDDLVLLVFLFLLLWLLLVNFFLSFFPFFCLPCIRHAHDIWAAWAGEICLQIVCFTAAGHVPDMGVGTWNMVVVGVVPCHCCCCGGSSNCWCKAWIWLHADRWAIIGLHACFHFNGFSQITHHLSHCWPVYTKWLNAQNCNFCYFPNALQLVVVSHCFVNYVVDISCFYMWFHLK